VPATRHHAQPLCPPIPTTASAPSSPLPSVTGSGSAVAKQYTKADLDAALLVLADLPSGYKIDQGLTSSADRVSSGCTYEAIALESYRYGVTVKTGTAFSTTSGKAVIESLSVLTADAGDGTLGPLKKAVAACSTWTADRNTYTLTQADYGAYGDESFGYQVSVTGGVAFVYVIVFVRKANVLMAIDVNAVGTGVPKDTKTFVDKAVGRLGKL
jgi:hypothetical protein